MTSYLAPDEHAAEDDLNTVEEMIADDDDAGAAGRPALARADRFDRRRRCKQNHQHLLCFKSRLSCTLQTDATCGADAVTAGRTV